MKILINWLLVPTTYLTPDTRALTPDTRALTPVPEPWPGLQTPELIPGTGVHLFFQVFAYSCLQTFRLLGTVWSLCTVILVLQVSFAVQVYTWHSACCSIDPLFRILVSISVSRAGNEDTFAAGVKLGPEWGAEAQSSSGKDVLRTKKTESKCRLCRTNTSEVPWNASFVCVIMYHVC